MEKELNPKQVRKELELFIDDNPVELHLNQKRTSKFMSFLKLVLDVITADEQKIFELENRLKECENGYEGTIFLDRCKMHDAEEKIKELIKTNERLISQVNRLKKYDEERDIALHARLISETRADTVRKMQERLKKELAVFGDVITVWDAQYRIDQIAKEANNEQCGN